jgi:hypothetical protein
VMTMIVTALLLHVMRRFERSPQHGYGVITV